MKLSIDFETRSVLDLTKVGVHKYARHPDTDIWCMAFAFDDEEDVDLWYPGITGAAWNVLGSRVNEYVRQGAEIRAWNALFERIIWREILAPRYKFPVPDLDQFVDTAAEAAALALPRGLEHAAQVLGLPVQKDAAGYRLMLQMCKPRTVKGQPGLHWWDDQERRERLYAYCKQDVRVEREVAKRLRPLSKLEREVYLMDQRMNDRGIYVDLPLVRAAKALCDQAMEDANTELGTVTNGEVTAVTKVQDLRAWVGERGLPLADLTKGTVRDTLAAGGEIDELIERALELRAEAGKSSTTKLVAFENGTEEDSRARGLYLFHAASTGRWGGKRIQPQNFPRPFKGIEEFIPWVMDGNADFITLERRGVPDVVSSMLRSMVTAAPGNVLRQGDYAQIEARILAWIAEQDDLVALFASGGKIYEEMAAYIYGVPIEAVTPEQRQVGKNTVLGCGFQMGPKRYREQAQEQTGIDVGEELSERAVSAYRERYDRIPGFWAAINEAAFQAVLNPGAVFTVGRGAMIRFTVRGQFLWCVLPSGRLLAYAKPDIRDKRLPEPYEHIVKPSITFMAVDAKTRKWRRHHTYGGHLTENVVQAMSRDLTAGAMLRLERAGYPPVITSHDEVVSETPEDFGSLDEFLKLMSTRPKWAAGLPVKVGGWQGKRYRK